MVTLDGSASYDPDNLGVPAYYDLHDPDDKYYPSGFPLRSHDDGDNIQDVDKLTYSWKLLLDESEPACSSDAALYANFHSSFASDRGNTFSQATFFPHQEGDYTFELTVSLPTSELRLRSSTGLRVSAHTPSLLRDSVFALIRYLMVARRAPTQWLSQSHATPMPLPG